MWHQEIPPPPPPGGKGVFHTHTHTSTRARAPLLKSRTLTSVLPVDYGYTHTPHGNGWTYTASDLSPTRVSLSPPAGSSSSGRKSARVSLGRLQRSKSAQNADMLYPNGAPGGAGAFTQPIPPGAAAPYVFHGAYHIPSRAAIPVGHQRSASGFIQPSAAALYGSGTAAGAGGHFGSGVTTAAGGSATPSASFRRRVQRQISRNFTDLPRIVEVDSRSQSRRSSVKVGGKRGSEASSLRRSKSNKSLEGSRTLPRTKSDRSLKLSSKDGEVPSLRRSKSSRSVEAPRAVSRASSSRSLKLSNAELSLHASESGKGKPEPKKKRRWFSRSKSVAVRRSKTTTFTTFTGPFGFASSKSLPRKRRDSYDMPIGASRRFARRLSRHNDKAPVVPASVTSVSVSVSVEKDTGPALFDDSPCVSRSRTPSNCGRGRSLTPLSSVMNPERPDSRDGSTAMDHLDAAMAAVSSFEPVKELDEEEREEEAGEKGEKGDGEKAEASPSSPSFKLKAVSEPETFTLKAVDTSDESNAEDKPDGEKSEKSEDVKDSEKKPEEADESSKKNEKQQQVPSGKRVSFETAEPSVLVDALPEDEAKEAPALESPDVQINEKDDSDDPRGFRKVGRVGGTDDVHADGGAAGDIPESELAEEAHLSKFGHSEYSRGGQSSLGAGEHPDALLSDADEQPMAAPPSDNPKPVYVDDAEHRDEEKTTEVLTPMVAPTSAAASSRRKNSDPGTPRSLGVGGGGEHRRTKSASPTDSPFASPRAVPAAAYTGREAKVSPASRKGTKRSQSKNRKNRSSSKSRNGKKRSGRSPRATSPNGTPLPTTRGRGHSRKSSTSSIQSMSSVYSARSFDAGHTSPRPEPPAMPAPPMDFTRPISAAHTMGHMSHSMQPPDTHAHHQSHSLQLQQQATSPPTHTRSASVTGIGSGGSEFGAPMSDAGAGPGMFYTQGHAAGRAAQSVSPPYGNGGLTPEHALRPPVAGGDPQQQQLQQQMLRTQSAVPSPSSIHGGATSPMMTPTGTARSLSALVPRPMSPGVTYHGHGQSIVAYADTSRTAASGASVFNPEFYQVPRAVSESDQLAAENRSLQVLTIHQSRQLEEQQRVAWQAHEAALAAAERINKESIRKQKIKARKRADDAFRKGKRAQAAEIEREQEIEARRARLRAATVHPFPKFNPDQDCKDMRRAMKGFGCDTKVINEILGKRSNQQRQKLIDVYQHLFGGNLVRELDKKTRGSHREVIRALMKPPEVYDAYCLRKAMSQLIGTNTDALTEILCTRLPHEIARIRKIYVRDYGSELKADVDSKTSTMIKKSRLRDLLIRILSVRRDAEETPIDEERTRLDAQLLVEATQKRFSVDASKFIDIFSARSFSHLRVVFDEYTRLSSYDILGTIRRQIGTSDFAGALRAIVGRSRDLPEYLAWRLRKSMARVGTDDTALTRLLVSRAEIDLANIKRAFARNEAIGKGETLEKWIDDDTSGSYRKLLKIIARGNLVPRPQSAGPAATQTGARPNATSSRSEKGSAASSPAQSVSRATRPFTSPPPPNR